jgi:O-antigen/teichoic acid export membrane protein
MSANHTSANLGARTVRGVGWRATSQLISQFFSWIIAIAIARLLGPTAYGLIGMITVFTGFAMLFGGLGLGEAIIQRKNLEKQHLDTAFWLNFFVGLSMTLAMIALAPLIAWFFSEPRLRWLTSVMASVFLLDALNVVQRALLRREMRFRALAGVEITSAVVAGIIGLTMAFYGLGARSLVAQAVGGSLMRLLLCWRVTSWRPSWSFSRQASKELFGFSLFVLGFNVVNYWGRNADNLLVGRFLGPRSLGIYSRAYSLMLLPVSQISWVVAAVMIPALCSIQDDIARVKRSYLKAISIIGLITFPMTVGSFIISEHLIPGLLGNQWVGVIPIFKILCVVGLLQSITTTIGWIYQSQGRTALQFKMGLIISICCVIAFAIGIHWGVLGVAWSYCVLCLIVWYPNWAVCGRIIGLSFSDMVKVLVPPFACAVGMGGIVWAIENALPSTMPHWLHLSIEVPSGVLIYLFLVASAKLEAGRQAWLALGQVLGDRLPRMGRLLLDYALVKPRVHSR